MEFASDSSARSPATADTPLDAAFRWDSDADDQRLLEGWRGYALGVAAPLVALLIRNALAPADALPLLNVFLVPIALVAYLGRVGPGLAAVATSILLAAYSLLPPVGSLMIESGAGRVAALVLLLSGLLVVLVMELHHRAQSRSRTIARVLRTTLASIGDAVIAADAAGRVCFMNAEAERLTGWRLESARGRALEEVFRVVNARHALPEEDPAESALASGMSQSYSNPVSVMSRDGTEIAIENRSTPIRDGDGHPAHGVVVVFRDVSFRNAALSAIERSELLNRAVLDSIASHVAVLDRHGNIVATNEAWRRFALENTAQPGGAPAGTDIGANYLDVCRNIDNAESESDLSVHEGVLGVLERRLDRFALEYPCHAPWEERWFMMSVTPLERSDGGAVVSHLNITARKRVEAALAESELRYRTLIEDMPDGVSVAQDLRFVYANSALERMLGYAPGELQGAPFSRVIAPRFLSSSEARFRARVGPGEQPDRIQQIRLQRKDGVEMWVEVHLSRITFNGRPAVLAIIRDDTERRRAEEELRGSNAKLQAALAAGEMGVWTLDLTTNEAEWDDFTARRFGIPFPERHAPIERILALIHSEDRPHVEAALASVRRRAENVSGEFRVPLPDGRVRWIAFTARPELDDAGTPVRVAGVNVSVTRRKLAEEQRIRVQKMEALGTLAGGVAHDFNNLLSTIVGNVKLAGADLPADHAARASLDAIDRASRRGVDLVRQILSFSRTPEEELHGIDLVPVVQECVRLLRATTPAMIELRESHDPPSSPVVGDAGQIHQVGMNLITNAVHAFRSGSSGVIEVSTALVEADAALAARVAGLEVGRYARLRVRDTGRGMTADVMRRIFDPFFTTKTFGAGTGLGLAVVQGIVRRHGGAIAVESKPNQGTTFDIYLPAAAAGALAARADTGAGPVERRRSEHVLLVDDEEDLVLLGRRLLERMGYRVTAHTRAEEALAAFKANPGAFDLLLTDLSMPRMSGFDLAGAVKTVRSDVPVVIMSGHVRDEDEATARLLGVRELAYKPTTIDSLGDIVDRVFEACAGG